MNKLQNNLIIKAMVLTLLSLLLSCTSSKDNYIYVMPHVTYEFSFIESEATELTPRMVEFLEYLAVEMQNDDKYIVEISGHSDNTNDAQTNLKLALTRAENASNYLKKIGIDPNRIKVFNKGTREPITNQNDERSLALNRRLELKMTF